MRSSGEVNSARALGMEDRIGSLSPGKQADVIVVGPGNDRLNMIAPANPVGAVAVARRHIPSVQTVLVAGEIVKRDGRLVDVDFARVRREVEESCEGVLSRTVAEQEILPEERGNFNALAAGLLPNFNIDPS